MTSRPAHDPLSEEMDLITWQEAAARLFDETAAVEREIAVLGDAGDLTAAQQASLKASQTRLDALRRVAARVDSGRPAAPDRTPGSGWN